MRSSLLLLFAVLAFATASEVSESGKKAIADARDQAENNMKCKLNGTDPSVLKAPLQLLNDLASAGKADQDAIAVFGDDDTIKPYLNSSLNFWKTKINEVILPYVTNPKAYENLVIDFPYGPEDPTWNSTQAYKEAEQNITELVNNATAKLQEKYSTALMETKANSIREVTCSTYFSLLLTRVHKELEEFLINNGQWAKHDSANGEIEVSLTSLKTEIENCMKQFDHTAANICQQFKNCTKK